MTSIPIAIGDVIKLEIDATSTFGDIVGVQFTVNFEATPADFTTTSDGNGGLIITGYSGSGGAVVIPGTINGLPVTLIGEYAFQNNTSITSVTIPSSVTSIVDGAFYGCTKLNLITVSAQNTDYSSVNGVLFNYNQSTLIQYPPGNAANSYSIPVSVTNIGDYAFSYSTSLNCVIIPNSVTSIGYEAFCDCTSLTSITIPNSVTSIGDYAFIQCSNLTNAVFQGNAPTMGRGVFAGTGRGFTVDYYNGATGFTSPVWTDSSGDDYSAQTSVLVTFGAGADDYITLTIGGTLVASYDNISAAGGSTGTFNMIPGTWYNITIDYKNRLGTDGMSLSWNQPGDSMSNTYGFGGSQVYSVPKSDFQSYDQNGNLISGLTGTYYDLSGNYLTTVYGEGNGPNQTLGSFLGYEGYGSLFEEKLTGQIKLDLNYPIGGTSLGDGWYSSAWFGIYNSTYYPWIYRNDIGFIYVDTSDITNLYLYVVNGNTGASLGWLYTSQSVFPNIYSFSKGAWLYYAAGGTSFYNYTTAGWETY